MEHPVPKTPADDMQGEAAAGAEAGAQGERDARAGAEVLATLLADALGAGGDGDGT